MRCGKRRGGASVAQTTGERADAAIEAIARRLITPTPRGAKLELKS